ncbi:MAG: hypothetical protein DMD45_17235 [Gemmatimonadetes bacterium]|nr:MAG: hypothetical protein DMD45_17235 [Gemmatimonadota bacterium]
MTALVAPSGLAAQAPARHVPVPTMAPRAEDVANLAGVIKAYYFVDASDSEMVHNGFFEREIHRVTQTYGNIAQVFSTYEEHRTADGPVEGRGINAVQLYWDGTRWWVASAIWFDEDPAHPIPPEFLP